MYRYLLFIFLIVSSIQADDKKLTLYTHPVSLVVTGLSNQDAPTRGMPFMVYLDLEYELSNQNSVLLSPSYLHFFHEKGLRIGTDFAYRYFPSGNDGFYIQGSSGIFVYDSGHFMTEVFGHFGGQYRGKVISIFADIGLGIQATTGGKNETHPWPDFNLGIGFSIF